MSNAAHLQDGNAYPAGEAPPAFPPVRSIARPLFGVVAVLMLTSMLGGIGAIVAGAMSDHAHHRHGPPPPIALAGIGLFVFAILLIYAQVALACLWIYRVWSWIPPEQRFSRHWKSWIKPDQAALMLLIPYFHLYWMFVVNVGLCDALDRLRVLYPTRHAAPKNLAIGASICQLVQSLILVPFGGIVWFVYMTKVERMTREMSEGSAPRAPHAI